MEKILYLLFTNDYSDFRGAFGESDRVDNSGCEGDDYMKNLRPAR